MGAYVARLSESLQTCGIDVVILGGDNWRAIDAVAIKERVDRFRPDVLHVQYPTLGYGSGIAPQLLSILRPSVVTLHEVRHTHPLRQMSLAAFALSARHVVFTTEAERRYALRFAPWLRARSSVIPVGSNVPAVSVATERRETEVVHFGLIRPEKGLEQVIELARIFQQRGSSLRVRIIGDVVPKWSSYFRSLRRESEGLPVEWKTGLPIAAVSDALAASQIGYLPFPDGATERRGSLLALLSAGIATITTRGADTPSGLLDAVLFARDAGEASEIVERLRGDHGAVERLAFAGRDYASRATWDSIATRHRRLYEEVLRTSLPATRQAQAR